MLCGGASLLYFGGMFLNDACDVRCDTAHRQERPIPSGADLDPLRPGPTYTTASG